MGAPPDRLSHAPPPPSRRNSPTRSELHAEIGRANRAERERDQALQQAATAISLVEGVRTGNSILLDAVDALTADRETLTRELREAQRATRKAIGANATLSGKLRETRLTRDGHRRRTDRLQAQLEELKTEPKNSQATIDTAALTVFPQFKVIWPEITDYVPPLDKTGMTELLTAAEDDPNKLQYISALYYARKLQQYIDAIEPGTNVIEKRKLIGYVNLMASLLTKYRDEHFPQENNQSAAASAEVEPTDVVLIENGAPITIAPIQEAAPALQPIDSPPVDRPHAVVSAVPIEAIKVAALTEPTDSSDINYRPTFLDNPPRPDFFNDLEVDCIEAFYGNMDKLAELKKRGLSPSEIKNTVREAMRRYRAVNRRPKQPWRVEAELDQITIREQGGFISPADAAKMRAELLGEPAASVLEEVPAAQTAITPAKTNLAVSSPAPHPEPTATTADVTVSTKPTTIVTLPLVSQTPAESVTADGPIIHRKWYKLGLTEPLTRRERDCAEAVANGRTDKVEADYHLTRAQIDEIVQRTIATKYLPTLEPGYIAPALKERHLAVDAAPLTLPVQSVEAPINGHGLPDWYAQLNPLEKVFYDAVRTGKFKTLTDQGHSEERIRIVVSRLRDKYE